MDKLRELLRDADPLRHEPAWAARQHDFRRQAILAATSGEREPVGVGLRSRIPVLASAALLLIAAVFLATLVWSLFNSNLQAAIRFEVRLAETRPAPGLQKAKVVGSDRWVYLHDEVLLSNSDIANARVVHGSGPSQYSISVEFNAMGAGKMRAATKKHIGRPMAILLDGQVVMAPVVRSPIEASAMITGHFTESQAERIVKGIEIH